MSNHCVLSVEHLSKFFKSGDQTLSVLHDISFAIEEGGSCAIVGPSGSGKTTLIAICAGLERPSEGSVDFNGVPLHRASEEEEFVSTGIPAASAESGLDTADVAAVVDGDAAEHFHVTGSRRAKLHMRVGAIGDNDALIR